ncbi:MAG: leucine-rich repeat domain-containing protein, partial [Methanomassiliicoccaceae archaeon]|nr:leucine-rich repeat domain-containing protein [Methanomassiliicoccaceae archaeon]
MESVKGRGNKNSGKNRNGGAQRSKKGPKALAILGIVAVLALATLMLSFSGASDNDNDGGNETNVGANIGETWDDTPNGLRYTVTGNSPRTASVQQVGAYRSNYTILDTVNIGSTLPDDYTVTSIAASGFQANTSISTITFPSPNTITTIGVQAFYGCTNFYFNGAYSIPSGVTSIGNMAFYGCRFTSVTVPSTVTSMGNSVFQSCTSLTGFTFNTLITTLPNSTFYGCTSLNNVTMPSSITTIGEYAFNGCTALSTITMGSVATIQGYAFSGCTALAGINLSTVTTVNTAAFTGSGLTSISIPSTLTTIQPGAFMTCNSLATITSSNPTYPVVSNVLFSNSGATLHTYPAGLSATSYAIPTTVSSATVTKLENYSFSNAKPATITIPSNITTIGSSVFYFCPNLSTATIPSSVTSSGSDIFVQCSSLTSITVQHTGSQGLSTIPNHLAYSCTNLTSVTLQNGITTISVGAFEGCSKLPTINIPASVIDIKEGAFNLTAGLETITVDPGNANYVTEPSAGGILYNTAKTTIVAYPANFDLGLSTVFTIPNGVTRIAAYAFNSCRLTEVVIPDGVTTIGAFAFGSSSSLLYIYLPSTVTNLEGALFNGVNAIRIFTAPTTMSSATQAYQGQGIAGLQIFYDRDLNISRLVATGSVFFSSSTVSLTTGGTPAFTMSGVYMTVAIPQVVTTFSNITGSGTSYTLTMPVANTAMYRNAIQLSGTYSLTLTTTVVGAPPGGTYQYNMTGGGLNTLLSVPTPGFTAISNSSPQTITVPHGYGLNANGLPVSGYT